MDSTSTVPTTPKHKKIIVEVPDTPVKNHHTILGIDRRVSPYNSPLATPPSSPRTPN